MQAALPSRRGGRSYVLKTSDGAMPMAVKILWPMAFVLTERNFAAFTLKVPMETSKALALLPKTGALQCDAVNRIPKLRAYFSAWTVDTIGTEDHTPPTKHGEMQVSFMRKAKRVAAKACRCPDGNVAHAVLYKNMVCAKNKKGRTQCCVRKELQMDAACKPKCSGSFVKELSLW